MTQRYIIDYKDSKADVARCPAPPMANRKSIGMFVGNASGECVPLKRRALCGYDRILIILGC